MIATAHRDLNSIEDLVDFHSRRYCHYGARDQKRHRAVGDIIDKTGISTLRIDRYLKGDESQLTEGEAEILNKFIRNQH